MNEENGIKTKINVAVLQERVDKVEDWIEKMENNHLPHIYDKLSSIERKMSYWGGAIAVLLGILQVALAFYAK